MRSSSSSSSRSKYKRYTKEELIARNHCDCPLPIEKQVAWTITNLGRRFKGCPIYDKDAKYYSPKSSRALDILPEYMEKGAAHTYIDYL
ncbi:hypothetical protein Tco_0595283 [Tanacetum coccineum]